MKFKHIIILTLAFISFSACEKDNTIEEKEESFEYHAHIHSPDNETKKMGQELSIDITFESHSGMPVHHINVTIYEKNDESVIIYNQPDEAHVHEEDGNLDFTDTILLSEENGFSAHTDYILKAKVWAHEAGLEEVEETVAFHVHPE
ncbi:VCBS domain-containing protein [Portibacter lacus]|nr:VCBS domain-containing protein [Portibacter lacus]